VRAGDWTRGSCAEHHEIVKEEREKRKEVPRTIFLGNAARARNACSITVFLYKEKKCLCNGGG
jgi:hypothetical protein